MTFWLVSGGLLLLALAFVGCGLIFAARGGADGDAAATVVNVRVHAEHQAELDRQLAAGEIAVDQYRELLADARRKLLAERIAGGGASDRGGKWLIATFALILPVLAGSLYWQLGAAPDVEIANALVAPGGVPTRIETSIRERLRSRPDNPYYWLLLARIEQGNGRFAAAVEAYANAVALLPEDGSVRAQYAQALFLAAGNQITGQVAKELAEALALAPDNGTALELAGIAAFAKGDYRAAIADWARALQQTPADSEGAHALAGGIARARERLGEHAASRSITLRVTLASTLHPAPGAAVFVFVREWRGRPMPLMARRLSVADLPVEITFTDDMALTPGRDLSSVAAVELVARVSAKGTPEPAPGDLEGRLGPLKPEAGKTFDLVIDQSLAAPGRSSDSARSPGVGP